MKRKPLKITWRAWCLYKLAKRDFSSAEMIEAIKKRAAESDQEVDPYPVVEKLVAEKLIDDERLVESRVNLQLEVYRNKGPLALREEFGRKKKIDPAIVIKYLDEYDPEWAEIAKELCQKKLRERGIAVEQGGIPRKVYNQVYQLLIRNGFSKSQIDRVLGPYYATADPKPVPTESAVDRLIQKRMDMGKGPREIQSYLKQQAVSEEVIRENMNIPEEVWVEIASREKEKRFGSGQAKTQKDKKKQIDFLMRRGFTYEQAKQAISSP